MSNSLDWDIDGKPLAAMRAAPSFWQRRRFWLLAVLILLPLTALGWMTVAANRRQAEMAAQVRRVAALEEVAQRSGNTSAFLALQDRTDELWLALQRARLKQNGFYSLPELGLTESGAPGGAGDVAFEEGYARLEISRTFSITDSAGVARRALLAVPQFYRPWGQSWVRAWPPPDWWGPEQTYRGRRLFVTYPMRAQTDVIPLAAQLDAWAVRACADWDCPGGSRFTIHFSTALQAVQWLSRADFDDGAITLPAPALFARPAEGGSTDPVVLGTGRLLVRALARELSGSYRMALITALVNAEQARLGLAPPAPFDHSGPIVAGWRNGGVNFLNSLRSLPAEATLSFLRDTYDKEGERALLSALHPPGPVVRQLAEALDLTPDALVEAWLAYGQAHWSNTAGLPPPQGHLALACDNAVKLRDLASATTEEELTMPSPVDPAPLSGAAPITWSADGIWLAAASRSGLNLGAARMKNLITGEERDLGHGWFVAWASDGQHYAMYRPRHLQTLIYALDGEEGQLLPGAPSVVTWSPRGDRLIYVAPGEDGEGVTVWVAAGDGTNARPLLRGYAPTWSPDGATLAYLPAGRWRVPGIALVDVSTGVTRTLITAADLSADLTAPGYAAQQTRVTAVYPVAWSPDGASLATWVALENSAGARMGLMTVGTRGRERRLWLVADWLSKITWSPDGRHLSAITGGYGETPRRLIPSGIWVASIESGAQTTVEGANFAWSPDGGWLAVEQSAGPAVFSADLEAVWRLPPGCKVGGWRPGQ